MYLLLLLLWIIFNGKITMEILLIGMVISLLLYLFICKFLDYSLKKDIMQIKKLGLIIVYGFTLLKEIIIANVAVLKLVTSYKLIADPIIIKFKTSLQSETAKVMLANSITLTPGTITVSLTEDEFVVHCLDREFAKGIDDSVFIKLLLKMEKLSTGKE